MANTDESSDLLTVKPKVEDDVDDKNEELNNMDREEKDDEATGPTLQVEIQATHDDGPELDDDDDGEAHAVDFPPKKRRDEWKGYLSGDPPQDHEEEELLNSKVTEDYHAMDSTFISYLDLIKTETPKSDLEIAFSAVMERKDRHIERLVGEIAKLKGFIAKRKQSYKRKRKDGSAPTRALSAYNIFVQDRFARLAKENDAALKSTDTNVQMQRVPPANLVASTGNAWKNLTPEEKAKYEERSKADRKRYEEQMAKYQPPDKHSNRKRNKTGYNMFFSAHVLRLKQSELGVPSERGSVARLVGSAWKALTAEEKQYYEREADKHNGMNPVERLKEDEEEEDDTKRQQVHQIMYEHNYPAHDVAAATGYSHVHPGMHTAAPQHDPRHHAYYYPAQHGYYDYSAHHQQQPQQQSRSRGHQFQYPPQQGHGYDYK